MLTCFDGYIKDRHTISWRTLWRFWCKVKSCQMFFFFCPLYASEQKPPGEGNESHIWFTTYETEFQDDSLLTRSLYSIRLQAELMLCITNRITSKNMQNGAFDLQSLSFWYILFEMFKCFFISIKKKKIYIMSGWKIEIKIYSNWLFIKKAPDVHHVTSLI